MSGFLVHYQHLELLQTHVHPVDDAIQPSIIPQPLRFPCPPAFNLARIRAFSSESVLHIRWPKCSFSFNISPSNEYSGLISLGLTGWISLQSKGLSRVFSNNTDQKHQSPSTQLSLWSKSHVHT